jgi:leucyl/phenylalanyl-tRNA--protein transferase
MRLRSDDGMPVYRLPPQPVFPSASEAEPSGLLAIGGDLSPERLLAAYASGIFPWYSEGEPLLWFSPEPRTVLRTNELRPDRGMRRTLGKTEFTLRLDTCFETVMRRCAEQPRGGAAGTWITRDMIRAYCLLHELGFAHSAEAWEGDELVGGVYGVSMGAYFAGESMFHTRSGASLAALTALVTQLHAWGIVLFDCQTPSAHVARLGATAWPRRQFLRELSRLVRKPTRRGRWRFDDTLTARAKK